MKKILSAISMTLMLAGSAVAETTSLWSGKPTENGSAFTEGETWVAGLILNLFILFLFGLFLKLCWNFLRDGSI